MAWSITERFPLWGENGEFPQDGFFYEGGDQVNEKHLDALWNGVKEFEGEVFAALNEIDSDNDGTVDEADYANNADTVDGKEASDFADSVHDNTSHSEDYTTTVEAANAAPVQTVNNATGDVKTFYRSSTKPTAAIDGSTWIIETDGSSGNTTGRYVYNADTANWELESAVGPSEPNAGTLVGGAIWVDTSVSPRETYVYSTQTGVWEPLKTPRPKSESGEVTLGQDSSTLITFNNTYDPESVMWGLTSYDGSDGANGEINVEFSGWETDGSGNITGMTVIGRSYSADGTVRVDWNIMGIRV